METILKLLQILKNLKIILNSFNKIFQDLQDF